MIFGEFDKSIPSTVASQKRAFFQTHPNIINDNHLLTT